MVLGFFWVVERERRVWCKRGVEMRWVVGDLEMDVFLSCLARRRLRMGEGGDAESYGGRSGMVETR